MGVWRTKIPAVYSKKTDFVINNLIKIQNTDNKILDIVNVTHNILSTCLN